MNPSRINIPFDFNPFQNFAATEFNPFHAMGLFLYPLKTSEKLWFSDVLRGVERNHLHEMEQ